MALIKCPECGKEISDQAPACTEIAVILCSHPLQMYLIMLSMITLSQNYFHKIITIKSLLSKLLMRSTGISMTEAKNKVDAYCSFAKKCISSSAHCTFCH